MAGVQYKINIQADASAAQRQVEQLSASLQRLQSNSRLNLKIDTNMADAAQQAAKLQQALQQAVNVNTGQINFSALSNSLASANTNVQTLIASFQRAGTTGQQAISQLSSVLTQATIPAQKATGIIASFGTTLMNTVKWQAASQMVHGLQSAMSGAVSYIENLNTSLNNIRVVTGKSISDMSNFAKEANVMAKSLSTSTKAYADAALIYYQQGDNDRDVQKKAQITLKAANTAFKANAAEMSEMLTAVWNSYKAGGDQLEGYVDVMAKLGSTTATSMEEIATALQKVAATASTVGVGMEQMSSIVATVSSVTRESAESIGTSFKTILARMGDLKLGETLEDGVNLGKVSSSLNSIGVQVLDATGNMRDMGDVITDLGNKWQTMGSAQKTAIAQVVAGKRQYTQLMALFENWDTYQKDLQNAQNSAGSLEKMQKIYEDSVKASKQRVQAAKESIFGDLINDQAIVKFNNALTTALSAVRGIVNGLGGIPGILATVASAMMRAFKPQMLTGLTNGLVNLASTFGPNGRFAAMAGMGNYSGQGLAGVKAAYNTNRQNGMSVLGAMKSAYGYMPTYGGYNRYMAQQGLSQENQMAAMQRYASVKWNGNSSQRALFDNLTTVQQTGAQNAALYNQRAQEARANGDMALGFQHTLSSEAATAQQQSAFLKQDALLRQGQMTQQQAAALQQRIDFMNNRQATLTEHATNLQDIAGNAHRELSIGSLATLEGTRSVDQFRQQFFDAQNGDGAWDALSDSGRAIARGSVNRAIASMAQETQNEARSNTLKNNFGQLVADAQNTGNFQKLSGILSKDNNPFANLVSDLVGKSAEDLANVDWDSVLSRDTLQQTQDAFERMFETIGGDSAARAAEYGEQQAREETSAAIDIAAAEEAAKKFEESGEAKAQKLAQGLMAAAQGAMAITQGLTQAQGIMNAWNSGDGLTFATSMISAGASLMNTFATQGPIMGAIQAATMAATAIFTAMENAEKERTQRMVENAQKTNAILEEHQNKSKEILDAEKQKNNLAEQFEEGALSAQEYSSALAEVASSLGIQGAAVMALTGNYEGLTAAIENSINASKSFALSQAQSDTRIAQNNLFNQAVNVMESNGLSGKYSKNGTSAINYWDILGNINTDLGNSNLINLLKTNPEFVNYLESQGVSLASREGRGGFNEDYIAALLGGINAGGGSKRNDFLINTDKESLLGYYNQIEALRSATANSTDLYQKQQLEALTGSSSFQSFASLISEMVEPYLNALKMERELSGNSWLTSSNNTIYTEAGKWSLDVRQQLINALLQNWGIAETDTSAVAEAARSQAQSLVDAYAAGLEGVSATEITKTASAQTNKNSALQAVMSRSGLSSRAAEFRMNGWNFTEDDWAILTDIDSFLDSNGNLSNPDKMPDLIRSRNKGLAASSVMSQWNSRFGENFDFESFGSLLPDMFSTLGITGYNSADWKTASSSEKASMVAEAMAQVESSYAEWSQGYVDSTTALQAVVDQATNSFLQKQFGKDLTQEQLEAKWMEQRQFQGFLEENLTADNNFNMDYDTLTTTLANAPFLKQFFASDYAVDSFGDRITDTDNYDFSNRMLRYIAHMSGMDLGDYDVGGDLFNSNTDSWIQNIDFSEVLGNLQSTEAEYNSLTKTLEAAKLFVATADGKEASLEWLNGADLDPTKWKDTELALNSLLLELGQGDHPTFEDWFGMSELDRTAYKLELMRKNLEDLKGMEGQEGYDKDRVKQLEAQYAQANIAYQDARINEATSRLATINAEYEKIAENAKAASDAIKDFDTSDLNITNITAFKQALLEAGVSIDHINEVMNELTDPSKTDYDKAIIKAKEMGNLALAQLGSYYSEYQQYKNVSVQDTIINILGYTAGGDTMQTPFAEEYTTYLNVQESPNSAPPDTTGFHDPNEEVEDSDYVLHWAWRKDTSDQEPPGGEVENKGEDANGEQKGPDRTFTWSWDYDNSAGGQAPPGFVQEGFEQAAETVGDKQVDQWFTWAYEQVIKGQEPPDKKTKEEQLKEAADATTWIGWAYTQMTTGEGIDTLPANMTPEQVEVATQWIGWAYHQIHGGEGQDGNINDLPDETKLTEDFKTVTTYIGWAYTYLEGENQGGNPPTGTAVELGTAFATWYYQKSTAEGANQEPSEDDFTTEFESFWHFVENGVGGDPPSQEKLDTYTAAGLFAYWQYKEQTDEGRTNYPAETISAAANGAATIAYWKYQKQNGGEEPPDVFEETVKALWYYEHTNTKGQGEGAEPEDDPQHYLDEFKGIEIKWHFKEDNGAAFNKLKESIQKYLTDEKNLEVGSAEYVATYNKVLGYALANGVTPENVDALNGDMMALWEHATHGFQIDIGFNVGALTEGDVEAKIQEARTYAANNPIYIPYALMKDDRLDDFYSANKLDLWRQANEQEHTVTDGYLSNVDRLLSDDFLVTAGNAADATGGRQLLTSTAESEEQFHSLVNGFTTKMANTAYVARNQYLQEQDMQYDANNPLTGAFIQGPDGVMINLDVGEGEELEAHLQKYLQSELGEYIMTQMRFSPDGVIDSQKIPDLAMQFLNDFLNSHSYVVGGEATSFADIGAGWSSTQGPNLQRQLTSWFTEQLTNAGGIKVGVSNIDFELDNDQTVKTFRQDLNNLLTEVFAGDAEKESLQWTPDQIQGMFNASMMLDALRENLYNEIMNGLDEDGTIDPALVQAAQTKVESLMALIFGSDWQANVETNEGMQAVGRMLMEGILSGMNIDINSGNVIPQLENLKLNLLAQLCALFGIHSPAETTKFIGQYLVEGIMVGMTDLKIDIGSLKPLEQSLLKALQMVAKNVQNAGGDLFKDLFKGLIEPALDGTYSEEALKKATPAATKRAIFRMFGIDEKTGELKNAESIGNDELYYKNLSDDIFSSIDKAIITSVLPDAAAKLKAKFGETLEDAGADDLLQAIEDEIFGSQEKLVRKIQSTWSQLINTWSQILDAIVQKDTQAAQQVLETWINTFEAIAEAYQSILSGLSIADALSGDMDKMMAMIDQLMAKGKSLAEIRKLWFSEDQEEVIQELNLDHLSVGERMARESEASVFARALNWADMGDGKKQLLPTSYEDYLANTANLLKETLSSEEGQNQLVDTINSQINDQITQYLDPENVDKQANLAILRGFQELGLLGEGDLSTKEGLENARLSRTQILGVLQDENSPIYKDLMQLATAGLAYDQPTYQREYERMFATELQATSDVAKRIAAINEIPLKESIDNFNTLNNAIAKLKPDSSGKVSGDLMQSSEEDIQRLMKMFGLTNEMQLLNLSLEELEARRSEMNDLINTQKETARQQDWLVKQGYELLHDDQGNLIGGTKFTTEDVTGMVEAIQKTEAGYQAQVNGQWLPIVSGQIREITKQQFDEAADWKQTESGDWFSEKLQATLTNQQYQDLSTGAISSAIITAGTLVVGNLESLSKDELSAKATSEMSPDWQTGNGTIDEKTISDQEAYLNIIKESASAIGMLNSELKDYINTTAEAEGGTMRWTEENARQNALLASAAEEYWHAEQAVKALNEAWDEGGVFETIEGGKAKADQLASAYETLTQAVNDFFKENEVGTEFVKENYDLIKSWAGGSAEAMEELEAKILETQLAKMFDETGEAVHATADQLKRLNSIANGLKFGEKMLGKDVKLLNQLQKELKLSNAQMKQLGDTMGIILEDKWGEEGMMTAQQFVDQFQDGIEGANAALEGTGKQIQQVGDQLAIVADSEHLGDIGGSIDDAISALSQQNPQIPVELLVQNADAIQGILNQDGTITYTLDIPTPQYNEATGQPTTEEPIDAEIPVADGNGGVTTVSAHGEISGSGQAKMPYWTGTGGRPGQGPAGAPSGGGGGGGGGGKKKKKGKSKAEIKRYHEVDQGIKRYDSALKQVAKKEEIAFGVTRVRLMREELEKMNKQMDLYQEKLNEAAAYASKDRANVEGLGRQLGIAVQFDENGTITNWEALQEKMIDWYNAHKDDEAEDGMEGPDDVYERMKKVIEDYEDSLEQLEDMQEKMLEQQHAMSEKMADIVEESHQWKIELMDLDLDLLQGKLDRMADTLSNMGTRAGIMAEALFGDDLTGLNGFAFTKMNEEMTKLNELQAEYLKGTIDGATLADRAQDIISELDGDLSDIYDRGTELEALFEDMWSKYDEALSTNTDFIDANITALQTLQEITDLIGAHKGFTENRKNLTEQYNQTMKLARAYKSSYDMILAEKAIFDKKIADAGGLTNLDEQQQTDYRNLLTRLQETQNNYYENLTSAADLAKQRWEADVEEMGTTLDNALAMGDATLDYLQSAYDRAIEVQERFLNTAHELYNVNKLNRQIEQAMADATDKNLRDQYEALQNVINAKSKAGQLTQYDADMMQKQYELLEKQAALRDAQNVKDTVRLTRDENGNYMYQYTADQDKVNEAMQDYNDVLIQINELSTERVTELEEAMLEKRKYYVEQAKSIALDETLTEEQKQAKLTELRQQAAEDDEYFQEQMGIAYENLQINNAACVSAFGSAVDEAYNNPTEGINPTIRAAVEAQDSMATSLDQAIDWLLPKLEEFADALDRSLYRTGLTSPTGFYDAIASTADFAMSGISDLNEQLVDEARQLDAVTDAWYKQKSAIQEIFDLVSKINKENLDLLYKIGGTEGNIGTPQSTGLTMYTLVPVNSNTVGYTDGTVAGNSTSSISSSSSRITSKDLPAEVRARIEAAKAKAKSLSGYASGGLVDYTGPAWVDGTPTKPELMLNATDTPNLLNTIDMLHSIDTSAVQNLLGFIGGLASAMSSGGVSANGANIFSGLGGLEQNVHISAEFPNATDRNEILAAFDELNNRASQYINQNR